MSNLFFYRNLVYPGPEGLIYRRRRPLAMLYRAVERPARRKRLLAGDVYPRKTGCYPDRVMRKLNMAGWVVTGWSCWGFAKPRAAGSGAGWLGRDGVLLLFYLWCFVWTPKWNPLLSVKLIRLVYRHPPRRVDDSNPLFRIILLDCDTVLSFPGCCNEKRPF